MIKVVISIFVFIIGACFGSFYLVIGKRLPKNEKVCFDRSKCDNCSHVLAWYDLVPIFSYIFLWGKCRYCKKHINILNLVVELTCGALFTFCYLHFGIGYEMFIFMIISSLMVIIYISDFSYYIILDSPLVVSTILSVILMLIYKDLSYLGNHLLSGLGLFITMLLIKKLGDFIFKRDSLGGGDIKLAFVMGLILGFPLGLVALILSAFLALPYSYAFLMLKKNNEVPYGPFLAASLFLVFLFLDKFQTLLDVIFFNV